jgi:hypothetical protein
MAHGLIQPVTATRPGSFLRLFDYGRASGILGMLRDKEHTSTIMEMPDVEEHLLFLCLVPVLSR